MKKIILASGSPRRKEILEKAGIVFSVELSDVQEKITALMPADIVQELSRQKAEAVAKNNADAIVIGSDTMVAYENTILGKPKDKEDAVSMLQSLQGKKHQVYTGVTVIWGKQKEESLTFYEKTDVEVFPMTMDEIKAYVDTLEPMDKAGSYAIQGLFGVYIKGIEGDYNNVVGLPMARLYQEMKKRKIDLRKNK